MTVESIEAKELTVKDIIQEAKKEELKLNEEINYKLPKEIGGYKIFDSYKGYLKKSEKGLAIELSDGSEDTISVAIIVKYVNGKIEIRDTQQEPFTDLEYASIELSPEEQSDNEDVNKINKYINSWGYITLTNKNGDISQLAAAIDYIKK